MQTRHARLEDGDAVILDLATDFRMRIEWMGTTPDIDERSRRRSLDARQDLLLTDLDRTRKLVATLLAEDPNLSRACRANRAPHAAIVSLEGIAAPESGKDAELGLENMRVAAVTRARHHV